MLVAERVVGFRSLLESSVMPVRVRVGFRSQKFGFLATAGKLA
jgi:hypothetical protein